MQRLKLGRRLGIGMAVAPLVVAFEGVADGRRVFQSGDRHLDVVALAAVAHLGVALEKHVAGRRIPLAERRAPPFPWRRRLHLAVPMDCR